ncbi:hypothetical protein [Shewanella violacea]|nr:hypothetical protein [Shewanella violacea]
MKPKTRSFFLANFRRENSSIDTQAAAGFFHVTSRTINNWVATGCPDWVDHYVIMYLRSIPDTKEWDGFKFIEGRLYTPYNKLTFAPSELMKVFYDRQFNRLDRVEREQLKEQVTELRSDQEAAAIRDELDYMIKTLNKLKLSPIVAPQTSFTKTIRNR